MTLRQKELRKSCYIHSVSDYDNCVLISNLLLSVSISEDTGRLIPEHVSFTIRSPIPTNITGENYSIIFTKYEFWRPIMNTMIVTVVSIILDV